MKDFTGQLFGGNWTEKKLDILRSYLTCYNTVLQKKPSEHNPFKRVYIDAFAGTGYRQERKREDDLIDLFAELEQGESEEFLKGSAKIALEIEPSFTEYLFIENDQAKVSELEKLKDLHPEKSKQMKIIQGDALEFVGKYCHNENWRSTRAVLFLDPFATQVSWSILEAVAATESIDVWILFPIMAVNRLLANDPEKVRYECLNRIFGTDQWFEAFYKNKRLEDIFGKPEEFIVKACDFKRIEEFYKKRLKSIFPGVAEKPRMFRNNRGSPLFLFFFAASNKKGAPTALKIANHLLESI